MIAPRVIPVTPAAAAQAAALAAVVPQLETARCHLRAPRLTDFDALHGITGTTRNAFEGGPSTPEETWADFCAMTAIWLLRGHGMWTIETRATGDVAGFVMISTEPGDQEHELGWLLTAQYEGQGIAHEAALAARQYAWQTLRVPSLVSYITLGNRRSEALARRLGATPDGALFDGQVAAWRHPHPKGGL